MPDADGIASALLAAPVEGGYPVESDELAAVRRDFAVQFANSRHLVDKSGGAAPGEPELLFMSRLLGLTGKVFAALWSRSNVSAKRLDAAAGWAARHLRFGQADFLPRENRTLAGRESLVYLHYLSVMGAMFNIKGKSFRQARERRTRFLEWVIGHVVAPALEIHPDFRGRLVDYLATALSGFGNTETEHPDVTREMLAPVMHDYISSFPEDWQSDLRKHPLLVDTLGMKEVEIVGIGNDFEFEADAFYAGLSEVRSTGRAVVPLRGENKNAVFAAINDAVAAPDRAMAFEIAAGGKTVNVSDDRLELETSDTAVRLLALKRNPEWFDATGAELDAAARAIADEPDFGARRRMLVDAQASSMTWRLRSLDEQVGKKRSSDKALLRPPHPDSLRRYLRLSGPIEPADATWQNVAFERLEKEFGPLGALARIGGVPFEFDDRIKDKVAQAVRLAGLETAWGLVGTPLVRTAMVSMLLAKGGKDLDLGKLADAWNDYGVLFQALLRLAFNSAARREEWRAVQGTERAILLWAHANAVLDVLQRQGVVPKEAARIIDGFAKQGIDDVFRRSKSPLGILEDPFGHSWRRTAGIALGFAICDRASATLDTGQLNDLRNAVARPVENDWLLEFAVWMPTEATEPKGCWLAVDPARVLQAAGVGTLPPPIDRRNVGEMALRLLELIAEEEIREASSIHWPLLWILGAKALDDDGRAKVAEIIGAPDRLPDFDAHDGGAWEGGIRYRAELYALADDIGSFKTMLVAAAGQAGSRYGARKVSEPSSRDPMTLTFLRLAEAIWQFSSVSSADLNGCAARFADFVLVLADALPACLLGCLGLLDAIAMQLETEPAGPLWDAINVLRAR